MKQYIMVFHIAKYVEEFLVIQKVFIKKFMLINGEKKNLANTISMSCTIFYFLFWTPSERLK